MNGTLEMDVDVLERKICQKMTKLFPYIMESNTKASHILDHVYLGGENVAHDIEELQRLKITHIVNCAEGYIHTGANFYGAGIKYFGFFAEDECDYPILNHYDEVASFMDDAKKSGGNVYIHCIMGINRSGALTVAYCMDKLHLGPLSAACYVKDKRSCILSNQSFRKQLVHFARDRDLLRLDQGAVK